MGTFASEAAHWKAGAERAAASMALDMVKPMAEAYLVVLKSVTPKRTGALAGSEKIDGISGGGTHAVAIAGPHKIYAKFRNDGGEISVKQARVLTDGESFFGKHVHQSGAHYMEKAQIAAQGPCAAAAAGVVDEFTAGL